ncbi:glutamate racemase [Brachyspira suanatina]|uniref:Glutamate racemase n=1 Tax=Brachyspira suanatina TaxID=381802 RepID=A0A0G4K6J1_9SPIR|nr:glutamate racemase [Brachyspira suanatina]CRF33178.1 glutamate racemase [Brachyspira suanatina]
MNTNSLSANMPIAVFDSGLGGLTVLKKLIEILPNENYVYIGDNANIPYGDKSKEEIINLTLKMTDFLVEQKCKMIIIACNTITACSYDILKQRYNIPIIEVISNAVIDALDKTKNNNISIMATEFTVNSNIYKNRIIKFNKQAKVTQIACKDLCPMIENGWYSYENRLEILKNYLESIDTNSDTLILGCTHYPHIINDIKNLLENDIRNSINNIIDPSYHTAISAKEYLKNNNLLSDNIIEDYKTTIFSTEKSEKINKLINILIPKDIYKNYNIKYVNL